MCKMSKIERVYIFRNIYRVFAEGPGNPKNPGLGKLGPKPRKYVEIIRGYLEFSFHALKFQFD